MSHECTKEEIRVLLSNALDLLKHVSTCRRGSDCDREKCVYMKTMLKHYYECPSGRRGGCSIYQKVHRLLQIHVLHCKDDQCCVPRCLDYKSFLKLALSIESKRNLHF